VILAGYPTVYRQHDLLARVTVPRIFVHSTVDEFGPREDLQSLYNLLWEPKQLHWIDAKDHFFGGSLDTFELKVAEVAA
jgi:uncharacterized protein